MEIPEDTEEGPDDEEEVQTYEAVESQEDEEEVVNLEDLEKVTLDLLVTKFLQGKLIFTIHFGFFLQPTHSLSHFVDENQKCELYTLICDQKNEIQQHTDIIRQVSMSLSCPALEIKYLYFTLALSRFTCQMLFNTMCGGM